MVAKPRCGNESCNAIAPTTGRPEDWIGVSFNKKFDAGVGHPPTIYRAVFCSWSCAGEGMQKFIANQEG